MTEEEIFEITAEILERAEAANLLYLGAFSLDGDRPYGEYVAVKETYNFDPPFPYTIDLSAMCSSFDTAEDIRALFADTFVPELAEAYAEPLLSGEEPLYTVIDGWLYRLNIPTSARPPLSLVLWEREGMSLLEQTEDRLVVEVPGCYMLTGHEALLPLTLTKVDGKWLLDESYSPREYPEEGFYSREELTEILETALTRVKLPDQMYAANVRAVPGTTKDGFGLVNLDEAPEELRPYLQNVDTVKKAFSEAFVSPAAEEYAEEAASLYRDTDRGLAVNLEIAAMPLSMVDWDTEQYAVYQNEEDALLLLIPTDFEGISFDWCPLRLWQDEGIWKLDETYAASSHNIVPWSWDEDAARAAIEAARRERLAPENLAKSLPEAQPLPGGSDGGGGRRPSGGGIRNSMVAVGETIYLLDESTPPYEIAVWRVQDGESTCLFGPVATTEGLANLSVSGDDVYFTLEEGQYAAGLYRLAGGTGTPELVLPFSARTGSCRVYGRTAYVETEEGLYAVPLDSGGSDQAVCIMKKTPEIKLGSFVTWEGGVAFEMFAHVSGNEMSYCLVSHQRDGQRTVLDSAEEPYMGLKIEDGILYHYDWGDMLYRVPLTGGAHEALCSLKPPEEGMLWDYGVCGNHLYVLTTSEGTAIIRSGLDGSGQEVIKAQYSEEANVALGTRTPLCILPTEKYLYLDGYSYSYGDGLVTRFSLREEDAEEEIFYDGAWLSQEDYHVRYEAEDIQRIG